MQAWLGISFLPLEEAVQTAVAAEAAGFDGVTVSDHLVWPGRIDSEYPYAQGGRIRWPERTAWPDPWVLAGAVLQATSRLRLVTNVYLPALRDPVVVAKAVGTAASLFDGRVALGVGAGWLREEFEALGLDFRRRGRALDEAIVTIRALLTGEPVARTDAQRAVGGIRMLPAPARPVPIWVGGHGERSIARAAANDGWIGVLGRDVATTVEDVERVRRQRAAQGPLEGFTVAITGWTEDPVTLRRLADGGVDAILATPGAFVTMPADERHAAIAAWLGRLRSSLA
jgi:probable F420-dependent oxidoreductase